MSLYYMNNVVLWIVLNFQGKIKGQLGVASMKLGLPIFLTSYMVHKSKHMYCTKMEFSGKNPHLKQKEKVTIAVI